MSLSSKYTVAVTRIPDLFQKIRDGQAPEQLSQQLLKDWSFSSSNDRAFIPMLKELGFLSPDGKPTSRYHEYRDHSRSKVVMAQALREAYSDLFLIKEHPSDSDKAAVQGKFKSFHNASDNVANLMMRNFYELLKLSDLTAAVPDQEKSKEQEEEREQDKEKNRDRKSSFGSEENNSSTRIYGGGLHYNIQIHLPATKDVEVYNAIFKSLKEHLVEQ